MSEQKKQNLANSSVRKDLLLICLTEAVSKKRPWILVRSV